MPQIPPKPEFTPLLPQDAAARKVALQYGERDNFQTLAVVPKGMFFAPHPDTPQSNPEWLLFVYNLDLRIESALRMSKVLSWRSISAAKSR